MVRKRVWVDFFANHNIRKRILWFSNISAGSFRPGSFRPILEVGRFGLGRSVVSALDRFGPESFRPNFNRVGFFFLFSFFFV